MTQYEVHSPDPQPYHEKHKPGKRVYIAGRITGVPLFKLSFSIADALGIEEVPTPSK